MEIILPPHLKPGSAVEDLKSIIQEAQEIKELIKSGKIFYPGSKLTDAYAVAQPQVSNNPLRYFVLNPIKKDIIKDFEGEVIVNPKILSKDKTTRVMFPEGCLSYPFRDMKKVKRFTIIKVRYTIIGLLRNRTIEKDLNNISAIIFQHEMQHLNGKSIYQR